MSSADGEFVKLLKRAAASTEEAVDGLRRRISERLGTNAPRQIAAYHGWADDRLVHLSGRVLSNKPYGGPLDDDGWWDNLVNTYRRWESDEVPGVEVVLTYQNQTQAVVTDEEGYYHADFPTADVRHGGLQWTTATACIQTEDGEITATHPILIPPVDADYGIISDMDDTVIHTGVTSILLAAKLTFLENAKTRKPLEGIAKLYQALQSGHASHPRNPIFYISSSPWNLHDLLCDFLRLNEIPAGPLMLQDLGVDEGMFIKKKGHAHKQEKALQLLDAYPQLPFILIGDSGQEDPAIYLELARLRPGRIKAIYIRDVDPEKDSELDAAVQLAVKLAAAFEVPMLLVRDSLSISEHARSIGLIPADAIGQVSAEVQADKARPDTGEQALKDAVESVLPEKTV